MKSNSATLDLAINAALKLDARNGERQNVLAFIQSCFGARVRSYDLARALKGLGKLTPEEHNALVVYVLRAG